jgi:hypothetical protein
MLARHWLAAAVSRVVSLALDYDIQRVCVLPCLGAGNHPGIVVGAGIELDGTRVVLIEQAIARVYPCLEGVFLNLCSHGQLPV